MVFTDLGNFAKMIPAEVRDVSVTAGYDSLKVEARGFSIGVRVSGRRPYDLLSLCDDGAPFHFGIDIHFDPAGEGLTDFWIEVRADLNLMMKMMIGGRIQEALDRIVDALVDASNGRMPQGADLSMFR